MSTASSILQLPNDVREVHGALLARLLEQRAIHLCLFLHKICSQHGVSVFAKAQGLFDILAHSLLLQITLPLLSLVVLLVDLAEDQIHLLLIHDLHIFLASFMHCVYLACLHIFSFDLASDHGATLFTTLISSF